MHVTHAALDHVLFGLIVVVAPLIDYVWFYPWLKRSVAAGRPGARGRFYAIGAATTWGLTACVVVLWAVAARAWGALHMTAGSPLRLGLGLGVAALCVAGLALQRRAVLSRSEHLEAVRRKLSAADPLLPHSPAERRGFMLLSLTAGICEEALYRGFVMWYVGVWTGPIPAALISSVLFGAAHIYLNRRHALQAGIIGVFMAAIVLAVGSLWPAMVIHAAIDMNSGELSYRALRSSPTADPGPA